MPMMVDVPISAPTYKQAGMISWLLECRGIIWGSEEDHYRKTFPREFTKRQASNLISTLLTNINNKAVDRELKRYGMVIVEQKQMPRSWSELVAESVLERALKSPY